MRLKSRTTTPPDGFIFSIPQIGMARNQSWSFGEMVDKYVAIAKANPRLKMPVDRTIVSNLLDAQNAVRVAQIKGGQIYLADASGTTQPAFTIPPPSTCAVCGKK